MSPGLYQQFLLQYYPEETSYNSNNWNIPLKKKKEEFSFNPTAVTFDSVVGL